MRDGADSLPWFTPDLQQAAGILPTSAPTLTRIAYDLLAAPAGGVPKVAGSARRRLRLSPRLLERKEAAARACDRKQARVPGPLARATTRMPSLH
jgi:hypothetical protein